MTATTDYLPDDEPGSSDEYEPGKEQPDPDDAVPSPHDVDED